MHEDKTAYESLDRRGAVTTAQGPIFHDQEPRETLTQNDPDSDNGFIPLSSDEETSPSLIRKETATPSTPTTSPSLIGHDDEMTPPRNDPTENDQDLRTPATTNKQRKAAHNESNQARLNQQSNMTTQGSEDNIDIERIATREREGVNDTSGSEKGSETRTTQDSEDDTDIDEIVTRERESDRTREEERERGRNRANEISRREKRRETRSERATRREREKRSEREKRGDRETRRERETRRARDRDRDRDRDNGSQTGSRNRSTISSNNSVITDEEEDSIASRTRNKRNRKHNKIRRRILTEQQQDDEDNENDSYEY